MKVEIGHRDHREADNLRARLEVPKSRSLCNLVTLVRHPALHNRVSSGSADSSCAAESPLLTLEEREVADHDQVHISNVNTNAGRVANAPLPHIMVDIS